MGVGSGEHSLVNIKFESRYRNSQTYWNILASHEYCKQQLMLQKELRRLHVKQLHKPMPSNCAPLFYVQNEADTNTPTHKNFMGVGSGEHSLVNIKFESRYRNSQTYWNILASHGYCKQQLMLQKELRRLHVKQLHKPMPSNCAPLNRLWKFQFKIKDICRRFF